MKAYFGSYGTCHHEPGDPECDGKGLHWSLLEVEYENISGQADSVRITRPDVGVVPSIDVRQTLDEAKRRLSDNLRFLANDIEKDLREAEYGARRVLEPGVDAVKLDGSSAGSKA
jgi:hypothetical protein